MGDIGIITEPKRTLIPETEPGKRKEQVPPAPPVPVPEREKVPV